MERYWFQSWRNREWYREGATLWLSVFRLCIYSWVHCSLVSSWQCSLIVLRQASGFSLTNEKVSQAGILLILSSVLFNLINVWMEEGIFRGLFTKILEGLSYRKSLFFIAFLFGIWHLVMPLRDYLQGESSLLNLITMGIGYVILAGMMSIKWSLLYKMTGSLWLGLGDHLFNNLASNLVHVVSNSESDSLQIVRIILWQLLSFAIVLSIYKRKSKTIANQCWSSFKNFWILLQFMNQR